MINVELLEYMFCLFRKREDKEMKYIKQVLIILTVSFIGELLRYLLPFPIPASIYGMFIMLILLYTKILNVNKIKEVGDFLTEIMPILFIPSAVGIMTKLDILKTIWLQILIITVVTTILVMVTTGLITQFFIKRKKDKKQNVT